MRHKKGWILVIWTPNGHEFSRVPPFAKWAILPPELTRSRVENVHRQADCRKAFNLQSNNHCLFLGLNRDSDFCLSIWTEKLCIHFLWFGQEFLCVLRQPDIAHRVADIRCSSNYRLIQSGSVEESVDFAAMLGLYKKYYQYSTTNLGQIFYICYIANIHS